MPAALKVKSGYLRQRVLLLPSDGSSFLIGRSLEANLILYGPRVSDRQAFLIQDGDTHKLVPISTKVATRVGSKILRKARVLQEGDQISIGQHELIYLTQLSRQDIGSDEQGIPCSVCGEPIGSQSGRGSLKALHVGKEVVCPRCVDLRLHADRELDSYRILRKISTNDEEVTYLAIDKDSGDRVAIRIMKADRQARPRAFRRFLVRALVGLVLDHPNYIPADGIRSVGGITYVILPHVENSTRLERLAREHAPFSSTDAIYVTNQLAEILRFARERQIIVAKRKKSGVLVDSRFWVKVLAYDVTRQLEEQVSKTFAFRDLAERSGMDPDQLATTDLEPPDENEARLSRLASEFAEVYSVGRILFQLLTGKPFQTGTLDVVRRAHMRLIAGQDVEEGPLTSKPLPIVRLLERVLIPRGEARIRTLEGFTKASKASFMELCG